MKNRGRSALKLLSTGGLAFLLIVPGLRAQAVLTWHNDLARTGQYPLETLLSPANVNSTNFGKLTSVTTDGPVDAQPLYVPALSISGVTHNVLYVVTENDSVYAFDADSGTQLWMHSVLLTGETASNTGCGQVSPTVGITSTPVIDLTQGTHGTIYLVAMTQNGSNYYQRLHALDLTTGNEQSTGTTPNWPILIAATYPNEGAGVTFVAQNYKERTGLLLSNGIIYTSWASNCDGGSYNGWVMGYSESNLSQVVLNLTPNGEKGAIWQSGAGLAADAGGDLYFLMANGYFDGTLNASGFPADGDYGNAFMNLSTITGPTVQDYFTSDNSPTETEGQNDDDLGSGGALLLPTLNDALGNPHALAVGAGKDGTAWVVDRNNMGKYNMSSNAVFQQISLGNGVYSSPAWFNNTLYYGAVSQELKAYPYSGGSFGAATGHSSNSFAFPGTTPSVSSDSLTDATNEIIWAVESSPSSVLYAFNSSLMELYDSTQAGSRDSLPTAITFPTPTIANGKVYVPTTTGVTFFGILSSDTCSYSVPPSPYNVPESGQSGGILVPTTPSTGCPFSAATTANFITITSVSGGVIYLNIPANPGPQRTGTLIIAGHYITVVQAGGTVTTTSGLGFYPLTPCRVVDTRTGSGFEGQFGSPSLVAAGTRSIPVPASFCNAPSTAQAYSVNLTAVVPSGDVLGYLTAWPAGQTLPVAANLNAPNGGVIGNAALVPGGVDHAISVYASSTTNLVIDMNGYFDTALSPQALAFYPVTPCRIADTRGNGFSGAFGTPALVGGSSRSFPVQEQSSCGIPSSVLAYSLRFTAIASNPLGYLTAYPTGSAEPVAATLNDPNGGVIGNAAIVPAGTGSGDPVSVYASANTNLVIDINGYFAPPGNAGALYFYPMTPCRVADTRGNGFSGSFGPPALVAAASRDFPMLSSACSIPSTAKAYSLNLTAVVPSGGPSMYLTAYPAGDSVPVAATLNAVGGNVVGSAAIVPANGSGDISVYSSAATNLIIDINGYFAP